jgi:enoyl-CoA hydratase/carnithine racemase
MPPPGSRVSGHHLKTVVAEPALRVYDGLRNLPVPVLSVVRGAAHGYGCALVAASDLAIAGETATFRVSEMERNIPPLLVLAAMLGRVPYKAMAHLALSCDEISALRARELGIVSEVVADDRLVEEADRLTNAIVGYDADAVRAIKEFLRTAPAASPHAVLAISANLTGTALARRFAGG